MAFTQLTLDAQNIVTCTILHSDLSGGKPPTNASFLSDRVGSICTETDTGDQWMWSGDDWYKTHSSGRLLTSDPLLDISDGIILGKETVNKFGRAPSGVQTTATDIWDRADSAATQQIWLAPTAARIHTIASDSASDVSGGTGATTVIVYYLADWDTAETTETVSGNLNTGIAMSNAAVMIHRMKVVPQSTSTTTNVGTITATAATDATITAVILPGEGQTQMAIYGIPSTQTLEIYEFYATLNKSSAAAGTINFSPVVNPNPDVQTLAFIVKNTRGLQSTGTSADTFPFKIPWKITGPAIIKIQGIASAADIEASAAFNGVLEDN